MSDQPGVSGGTVRYLLLGVIGLLLALQAHLAVVMTVNWDEFYFLSQVHADAGGRLEIALNTFHAELFQWLRLIPGGEINQVVAGRLVMLAMEVGTVVFLVRIARRFVSPEAALAAGATYLAFGYVLAHGASFRTDPAATCLLMGALWLVVCSDLRRMQAVAVGLLLAVAALVTIKSVFYLPTIAIAALWRLRTAPAPRQMFGNLALGAVVGAVVLGALFLWHSAGLAPQQASSADMATAAYRKTVGGGGFFPRWPVLQRSLQADLLAWLLLITGAITAVWATREDRWRSVVLLSFALPLLTFAFYRNAFPYFFAFVLALACVLAGVTFQRWLSSRLAAGLVILALLVGALLQYGVYVRRDQQPQRAVVAAVHRMFPEPVPYIERAFMIGSFPHAGFFMTTWGMESYRATGRPLLRERAATTPPAFVIVGHPALDAALRGAEKTGPGALLPEDAAFLRKNFIPHWGAIWVAGKRLGSADREFEIAIPGPYTVEANGPVRIDGRLQAPGDVVILINGRHSAQVGEGVVLRYGDHLYRPSESPPPGELYWGF